MALCPAHECVAVPQSLDAAAAMPKHFSDEKVGTGAGPPADAKLGIATAAMTAEAISRLAFIDFPFCVATGVERRPQRRYRGRRSAGSPYRGERQVYGKLITFESHRWARARPGLRTQNGGH